MFPLLAIPDADAMTSKGMRNYSVPLFSLACHDVNLTYQARCRISLIVSQMKQVILWSTDSN